MSVTNFLRTGIHWVDGAEIKLSDIDNLFDERLQQKISQNYGGNGHVLNIVTYTFIIALLVL